VYIEGRHLISNLLAIEVPVVIAVNDSAIIHSELAVMGDVVIATPDAVGQDTHYKRGMVPGDGVHVIWPELLGANRGRHYLYLGAPMSAQDALAAGVIAEIVGRDAIVGRAHEIAREIAEQDDVVRRYTRILLTRRMRSLVEAELCLTGPLAAAEPKTLRWSLWHTPARIIRQARRHIVRVLDGWPTTTILLDAYQRIELIT
jgi:enoyl-CoA hydratase/carnithine racemase